MTPEERKVFEQMREVVLSVEGMVSNCDVSSGVCCCGVLMNNHPNPMYCGHSPVDSGVYAADSLLKKARDALAASLQALQEQEPVADGRVYETIIQWDEGGGKRSRRELARRIEALYAAPKALEPLTPQQKVALFKVFEAAKSLLSWVEAPHRPPVRDNLETGRMVLVRLHALADLHDALAVANTVSDQPTKLDEIEQYRLQMAGISTAALGYWKEGGNIHPDYDTVALRDVAKLYAKYDLLYRALQPQGQRAVTENAAFQHAWNQFASTIEEEFRTSSNQNFFAAGWRAAKDAIAAADAVGEKDRLETLSAMAREMHKTQQTFYDTESGEMRATVVQPQAQGRLLPDAPVGFVAHYPDVVDWTGEPPSIGTPLYAIRQLHHHAPVGWIDDGGMLFWRDKPLPDGSDIYAYPQPAQPQHQACKDCGQSTKQDLIHTCSPQVSWPKWQPIETAPRDGRRIFLFPAIEVADTCSKGHWSEEYKCWIVGGSPSGIEHTHWQPMPPAPEAP